MDVADEEVVMNDRLENPLEHYTDEQLKDVLDSLDEALENGAVEIPAHATKNLKTFDDWMRKY